MTTEEALSVLQDDLVIAIHDSDGINPEYEREQVESLKAAIIALEKQIPKKPIAYKAEILCPACQTLVGSSPHCRYCGQALDWSDYCE